MSDRRADGATVTDAASARLYELPGRHWKLVLGPENSGSSRLTMAIATFPPGSAPEGHAHPVEDEVVYVLSGRGWIVLPDGSARIESGSAYHIPAGVVHGAVNDGIEPLALLCVFNPPVIPGSYED